MSDGLLADLRACFGESLPTPEQRAAIASSLGARGEQSELAELTDVATKLRGARTRTEVAVAAAHAMRILMQAEALAAEQHEAAQPKPSRSERRREATNAALTRRQARALASEPSSMLE